ncbi:MAG: hypothetical protein QNJ05_01365 [Woeseiaceae bacterium]|nr:hypothetical protein [Woeseiaceae bacterium]
MMGNQLALIKREIWEHRSIYITPAAIAIVMLLLALTGQVAISALGASVDLAMMGANELPPEAHKAMITGFVAGLGSIFVVAMWILTIFYSLDSLYAERKDKSILFWRSLPVTDAETVLSKLLVAIVVIPLVTFAAIAVTQILSLIFASIWLNAEGGNAGLLIWQALDLVDIWGGTLIFVLALPIWLSPFVGWYLFVSAWAKRMPLLIAFLPLFVLPMIEKIVFGTAFLASAFFERTASLPLFNIGDNTFAMFELEDMPFDENMISLLGIIDLGKFLSSLSLWAGLIVCGLFTTAAIYVRRYRDES